METGNKRMAGEYEIKQCFCIGTSEIVIGESLKNEDGLKYMIADYSINDIFERYDNVIVSNDYFEILDEFQNRIRSELTVLKEKRSEITVPLDVITEEMCYGEDYTENIIDKVIVIRQEALSPEYRSQAEQIMRVTGGNGAQKNARGTAVFIPVKHLVLREPMFSVL